MKENKLIAMQNQIAALTHTLRQLIIDFTRLDELSRGTLTAFQLYLGEKKWDKLVEELKNIKKKEEEKESKLEIPK